MNVPRVKWLDYSSSLKKSQLCFCGLLCYDFCAPLPLNFTSMKRFFLLLASLFSIVLIAGCTGASSDGPSLFNDEITNNKSDEEEIVIDKSKLEEFGNLVKGTSCFKQLHGGCVPSDYTLFDSDIIGLHFMRPFEWVQSSGNDTGVSFVKPTDDENPLTRLFVWRAAASDMELYKNSLQKKVLDAGVGVTGPYDAKWEIYQGTWQDQPVKSEWVTLTIDEYNPWINFVFMLMTQPENFAEDQMVLKGAVSSAIANTPGL